MSRLPDPLRKVVGVQRVVPAGLPARDKDGLSNEVEYDVLDCGHMLPAKQDAYGETHPTQRRCPKCGKRGVV